MRPVRKTRPLISTASLLLYLAAVLGLPIADAVLAVAQGPAVVHVESDRQDRHSHGHDHQECLVCRTIDRSSSDVAGAPVAVVTTSRVSRPESRGDVAPPRLGRFSPLGPRAPPLA